MFEGFKRVMEFSDNYLKEIEAQAQQARPESEFLEGDKLKEMEQKWQKEKEEMLAQMEELKKSIETKKEPEPDPDPEPDPENKE